MSKSWKRRRREDTDQPSFEDKLDAVLEWLETKRTASMPQATKDILDRVNAVNTRHPKP